MADQRIEKDTFGDIAVAADCLWGAQTERSLHHFDISTEKMPAELIRALAWVKRSAAVVNRDLGALPAEKAGSIVRPRLPAFLLFPSRPARGSL